MPLFRVEAHKNVAWLHLDPAHFVSHVDPALLLEELGGAELGPIIGHVVEHVEEYSVGEGIDAGFGQPLWLAHVVTLGNTNVYLEAVTVVCPVLGCLLVCNRGASSLRCTWSLR